MLRHIQTRPVFAMPADVRDRPSRRLLLAHGGKIMNCNDSPKPRQKIYRGYAFTLSIYVCHRRLLSAQMILRHGELMVCPPPPQTPCTDSTFDNEEENAISVKTTSHVWRGKNEGGGWRDGGGVGVGQTAEPGTPCNKKKKGREEKKTDDDEKFPLELV